MKHLDWKKRLPACAALLLLGAGCEVIEMANDAPSISKARFAGVKVAGGAQIPLPGSPPAPVAPVLAIPSAPAAAPAAAPAQVLGVEPESAPFDVVFGGDVVPQARMLTENPADLVAKTLPLFAADAFVFNLEGPVGSRRFVSKDKNTLAFATPPEWLGSLLSVTQASAFGAANNHACDLEQGGLGATQTFAEEQKTLALGLAHSGHAWKARVIAERDGRRVCALSWTTFLNDDKKRHDTCRQGRGNVVVARAGLDADGFRTVRTVLSDPRTWENCDVRVANVHGGIEYRAQSAKMMYLARMMAPQVDAIVFAHTHVPDGVELIENPMGSRQRQVPVFRSLGNLLSNQGAAWSEGMSTALLGDRGAGDPIRTVWTRVAVLARLRFGFATNSAVPRVSYGYDLAFLDRSAGHPALIPLGRDAPLSAQLSQGTFGALLDAPCRRKSADRAAPLPCEAH